ncbi:other FunK1 protein kinase [Rhizoctonia solani]|nr:other FunK1 protein kinase [Rhizoctonia solani]
MSAASHIPSSPQRHTVDHGEDFGSRANKSKPSATPRKTAASRNQVGTADTNTPFRSGSAQRTKESAGNSRSISKSLPATDIGTSTTPAGAPTLTQVEMGKYITDEMHGGIFCDPNFVANFLAPEKLKTLLDQAVSGGSGGPNTRLSRNPLGEREVYRPIVEVLNRIKLSVDEVRRRHQLGTLGPRFIDCHSQSIFSKDPKMSRIKPDLVMFEDNHKSWETLMMPIEVKSKHTYLKVGMKQLAQYAQGIFAHQIHQRYVFGMVICWWAATFVCFDQSGILHLKPIDMQAKADRFKQAFAGLMMLDCNQFGYNTAFTVQVTEEG